MTHTVSLKDFRSLSVSFSKITNRFHDFDKKSLTKAKLLLPKLIHLFAKLTQSCKTLRKYLFRHSKGKSMVNLDIVNALGQNLANSESCSTLRLL